MFKTMIVAELKRQIIEMKRYWFQTLLSMLFLNALFLAMFFGFKSFSKTTEAESLVSMIVGYALWILISTAYSTIARDIATEDDTGTIEQVYISSPNFTNLLLIRVCVGSMIGIFTTMLTILWTMAVTGIWFTVPVIILPILVITLPSAIGIGFIIGGFGLYFKRIMPLTAAVNFSLIGAISLPAETIFSTLAPISRGATLVFDLVHGRIANPLWMEILAICTNSGIYFLLGLAVFKGFENLAVKHGLLGQH